MKFSVDTNTDSDIDNYTKVTDHVNPVNYYNFAVSKRCEKNIFKVIKPCVNDFQTKYFTT